MGALYTVESPDKKPNLAEAAAQLNIAVSTLDPAFGVVAIDPVHHLYAVRTLEDVGNPKGPGARSEGPFSDPQIEPFGPIKDR
jgi:cell division protein ZapA (FtsZ GTPase activity inhibitor)